MRAFASLVALLCLIGFARPAQAVGMQFCDDITDDHARMACLQEHISHLEETIVALGGRVAALEDALQKMLAADASYKLKSVASGKCLGLGGDNKDTPALVSCDMPDSWSVSSGAPIKKPAKTASPAADSGANHTASSAPQTSSGGAAKPDATACKGLGQDACAAKADTCVWKADKKKCSRKSS